MAVLYASWVPASTSHRGTREGSTARLNGQYFFLFPFAINKVAVRREIGLQDRG